MARVLRMPEVAANTTEAVLSEWLVAESTAFDAGAAIATVETEKAAVDVEADAPGVLLRTLVSPGALVEVGAPIAVLAAIDETVEDLDGLLAELGVAVAVAETRPERREVPETAPAAPVAAVPAPRRIFASPLARRLAADAGLELARIAGTGPRNRVLRRDVDRALAGNGTAPPDTPAADRVAPSAPSGAGHVDVPHSRLRRAVAQRLADSKRTAPHFYLRAALRADRLVALRAEINEGAPEEARVSLNDLLVRAVAVAHRRVPELNVVWTEEAVRRFETVDVAVAVATDRGLLTPVVRDVGSLPVTAIAARIRDLAARARDNRLRPEELEGGSISVTNLGMYGVDEFAAIINPPHAAILAVGAVREEVVVEAGVPAVGQVLRVTLSVDHRPVDGVAAARWMAVLRDLVEHPARLLA